MRLSTVRLCSSGCYRDGAEKGIYKTHSHSRGIVSSEMIVLVGDWVLFLPPIYVSYVCHDVEMMCHGISEKGIAI